MIFGEPTGQGVVQFGELALAVVLSAIVGIERELKQKSAGFRTYSLVGLASALIVIVSKYGFTDVLASGQVVLDPSRVAAQIVSGIGFIGGGLIFVRRDAVRGLTTAAGIWLTAGVGMACGAGLPYLACAVTVGHLIIVYAFPLIFSRFRGLEQKIVPITVHFQDSADLDGVSAFCRRSGLTVLNIRAHKKPPSVQTIVRGSGDISDLVSELWQLEGVAAVDVGYRDDANE